MSVLRLYDDYRLYWLFSPPLLRQIVNKEIVGAFAPFLTSTWDLLCRVIIPFSF